MALSPQLRIGRDSTVNASQAVPTSYEQFVAPCQRRRIGRVDGLGTPGRESIEPAAGFSLLHTLQLVDVGSPSAQYSTPTASFVTPGAPPAAAPPAHNQHSVRPPHIVQHCERELRIELGAITGRVFDIIAGRRRIDDLRRLELESIVSAAVITMSKNKHLKGVALQSFHASASAEGTKVEFLGSCRTGHRVRAFTGTFRRRSAKTQPWVMTAFRVL